jgi:hypothetical protein
VIRGSPFELDQLHGSTNLPLVTGGAEWRMRSGWSVLGKFDGELANRSQTYIGTA